MAADTASAKPLTKVRVETLRNACSHIYQYPAGKMVKELVAEGFLAPYRNSCYYRTTAKGREAVRAFDAASTSSTP